MIPHLLDHGLDDLVDYDDNRNNDPPAILNIRSRIEEALILLNTLHILNLVECEKVKQTINLKFADLQMYKMFAHPEMED